MPSKKISNIKKWVCGAVAAALLMSGSSNGFKQKEPLVSEIDYGTYSARCGYDFKSSSIIYSFFEKLESGETKELLSKESFQPYLNIKKAVGLSCHNDISIAVTENGDVIPLPGYNKIALMGNYLDVDSSTISFSRITNLGDKYDTLQDKIVAATIDYRDNLFNGILFITEKGVVGFLSINSIIKNDTAIPTSGTLFYSNLLDEEYVKKTNYEIHNGWIIITTPIAVIIRRYDNDKRSYQRIHPYSTQNNDVKIVHDETDPNLRYLKGDNGKVLFKMRLEKDCIITYEGNMEIVTKPKIE
ncbi:MAG: hypothetical protein QXS93_00555 [Candidatus Micrarchaeia archaeon]